MTDAEKRGAPGTFEFTIDVPGRSEWANVELLRTSILNCFMVMFSDVDGCEAIAMVTGELLENAVKYGDWSGACREFRLSVSGDRGRVRVSIENPVRAGDPRVDELLSAVSEIAHASSPAEAYRARLVEIASRPRSGGSSKLGLLRISYEAGCRLGAALEGDRLRVTADMSLQ